MPRLPRTVLGAARADALRSALDALVQAAPAGPALDRDPLAFVRRYGDPLDQEVAAFFAAGLAFGRVAAFRPVLQQIFDAADRAGGPAAWVAGFGPAQARALEPLVYRWVRGPDLALLAVTLGRALAAHGRPGAIFEAAWRRADPDLGPTLARGTARLRALAAEAAPSLGLPGDFEALPRGFRVLLASPADGSACKRLCMLARWMVRPPGPPDRAHGLDLGLWALPPARLVMPLDTHVHRLGLLLGLTRRPDGSWATAVELTRNLRRLDPDDPLRYDFALAHLGISGQCTVRPDGGTPPAPAVCRACPLVGLCKVGRTRAAGLEATG